MGLNVYQSSSEETLIEACIRQDGRAQKEMYEKFAPRMYSVCMRYIKEAQVAEDILVTGFMKVFEKIDSYKGTGSLEGWIRRIMVNQSLYYLRQNKNMYLEVDIEKADEVLDWESIGNSLEANELMQMVQNLPVGYRSVFNLYAIEGYSHREIAEALNISENTSKSQLSRARALLRKQLENNETVIQTKLRRHE